MPEPQKEAASTRQGRGSQDALGGAKRAASTAVGSLAKAGKDVGKAAKEAGKAAGNRAQASPQGRQALVAKADPISDRLAGALRWGER